MIDVLKKYDLGMLEILQIFQIIVSLLKALNQSFPQHIWDLTSLIVRKDEPKGWRERGDMITKGNSFQNLYLKLEEFLLDLEDFQ